MTDEPYSSATALAYPLAGAFLLLFVDRSPETLVVAVTLLFLGVATAVFHLNWSPVTSDLDHAGMIAMLVAFATAAAGGGWPFMAAGAVLGAAALVYWRDRYSHELVGLLAWISLVGVVAREDWGALVAALSLLGLAFAVRGRGSDREHAAWHLLTAFGLTALWLGLLP